MMNEEISKKWLDRVAYDIETARAMFQTGRLIYAIFMCQQALEKCFKALLVHEGREILPIHNLRRLAEQANVIKEFDDSTIMKLDFLSSYYINARYKEDLDQLSKGMSEAMVEDFMKFSEGLITWLCQKIK